MIFSLHRWLALTIKELQQLRKNRQLLFQLLFPPTVGLILFGFSLNPEVKHLRMGLVDQSQTPRSREFVDRIVANQAFDIVARYAVPEEAASQLRGQALDLMVVIPPRYGRRPDAEIQVVVDAVNSNTATMVQNYLEQIASFGTMPPVAATSEILYNPGTIHAWYFVTGVLSIILFINGGLTASALTVREKETGAIEQLLMSPAQTSEILLAKTAPVLGMMLLVLTIGLTVARLIWGLPVRGSLGLLALSAGMAALSGIGIGITAATFARTQQQAQLLTFFTMPPLVIISGAFAPVEAMPVVFQYLSLLDPIRYMASMVRGVTIKGSGIDVLWPQMLTLGAFSLVLFGVSAWRFRRQLR